MQEKSIVLDWMKIYKPNLAKNILIRDCEDISAVTYE